MERKKRKFSLFTKLDRLEVYLIAAENPIGRKQLRPVFRRKRSKEILTREQVTAIKRGRRVLRREMKERGIKRWTDFDQTATSLGLYFDRNRFLAPILFWFMGGNTAVKILATTAVLTTLMTVTQPVIEYLTEYITQYLTQYVTKYVTQYVDKDRFTISLSDEMMKVGFELSETPDFKESKEVLVAVPAWQVPCISISEIPADVDELDNNQERAYFAYTFYCRYIDKTAEKEMDPDLSKYATNYTWGLRIHTEGVDTTTERETISDEPAAQDLQSTTASGLKVSDAVWVMVIQDDEVILCAKSYMDEDGNILQSTVPSRHDLEVKRVAFADRSIAYINKGLAQIDERLNVDNVNKLETLFNTQSQIDDCQRAIDAYFEREGISALTQLMLRTDNWRDHYKIVGEREDYNYYQVVAEGFVSDKTVVERTRENVLPWVKGLNEEYHKYTVVIWLEGDDPECRNELMNGFIGMNFQIKFEGEDYMDTIETPTIPVTEATAGE